MVEHLTDVPPMEVEMGVTEVDESDNGGEENQVRVISLTFSHERIFTCLVTVRQIMDIVLLFKRMSAAIAREVVHMALQMKQ